MVLNKQKGNMYGFVTDTFNMIKGHCSHECNYCYMKNKPVWKTPVRLDEKEFKTNLGSGKFIFVGSSTDMFAKEISHVWILRILEYCRQFDNKYLFQTKNPHKLWEYLAYFPKKTILGTTIETNRYVRSHAPPVDERYNEFKLLSERAEVELMLTIEPIMDFDLDEFSNWIKEIKPKWVNIGADSGGNKLPEPSPEKIRKLIFELQTFTEVKLKPNLRRLLK